MLFGSAGKFSLSSPIENRTVALGLFYLWTWFRATLEDWYDLNKRKGTFILFIAPWFRYEGMEKLLLTKFGTILHP
jgi:hypothetical protein